MNIEEILKKHIDADGKLNVAAATKELKDEQGKVFVPKADFNEKNEELKKAKTEITNRDTQLEELKKVDAEKLQTEITTLQQTNKDLADKHAAEIKQLKIDQAIERHLSDAKAKNTKAVKALLDLEHVELSEDGSIKNLDSQLKTLKESDAYLFEPEKTDPKLKGSQPGNPKNKSTDDEPIDLSKMDYMERLKLMESNPEAYKRAADKQLNRKGEDE